MPISFIAEAHSPEPYPGGTSTNRSSFAISKPTGTVSGDVMIAYVDGAGGIVVSPPSGWTLIGTLDNSSTPMLTGVYYKVAGGSEPSSYTWSCDYADAPYNGAILTFRGVDTSAVTCGDAGAGTTGSTTESTPSVTNTQRALLLHYRMGKTTTSISTLGGFTVTGYTERARWGNRGGSTAYFNEVCTNGTTIVNPGTQSGVSFTSDRALTGSNTIVVALTEYVAPVNASAGKADITANAYNAGFLRSHSTAYAAALADAKDATVLTGIAAENVPQASAQATAYNAMGWVIHPVDVGAIAFNASVHIDTEAAHAAATATLAGGTGYFGAPPARVWRIAAEDRSLSILAESRVYRVEA